MLVGIFGAAGAIGTSVGAELRRRGIHGRVVGRREAALKAAFGDAFNIVTADLTNEADTRRAACGLDAIVYAVGVPYNHFDLHAKTMHQTVEGARNEGVKKLIVISNVYSYGMPRMPRVDETHPREPQTYKGRMRKEQEDIALAANDASFKTLVLRLPDFYGADAENSMAHEIFKAARDGKAAPLFAPIDAPHEWIFTPDVGPIVVDLLQRDDVFGTGYNLGGSGVITTREFAARIYEAFGAERRCVVVTPFLLRVLGIFNPLMRELVEMNYLQSHPVILDDSRLAAVLGGLKKTGYIQGIELTAHAYKRLST